MISKPFLFMKFKLKLPSLMTKSRRKKSLNSSGDSVEEYVDISWRYTNKQPRSEHQSFSEALSTLPWYDVMDSWMATVDLNPCNDSQCTSSCGLQDEENHEYACVVSSNQSLIECH